MTTAREPKIPGSEPPITIEPAGVRVVARVGARIPLQQDTHHDRVPKAVISTDLVTR